MQIADKPSYVTFEYRTEEDRTASIEAGHYVGKEIAYAIITPQGTKDRIERVAVDWLDYIKQQVKEGRFPLEWSQAYQSIYKEWLEGRELPLDGTPIVTWPALNQSQVKLILDANIRTVEDLANANDAGLNSIGMGGRALQQKAKAWLATAETGGKSTERVFKLEVENDQLKAQLETQSEQITALMAKVDALTKISEDA